MQAPFKILYIFRQYWFLPSFLFFYFLGRSEPNGRGVPVLWQPYEMKFLCLVQHCINEFVTPIYYNGWGNKYLIWVLPFHILNFNLVFLSMVHRIDMLPFFLCLVVLIENLDSDYILGYSLFCNIFNLKISVGNSCDKCSFVHTIVL